MYLSVRYRQAGVAAELGTQLQGVTIGLGHVLTQGRVGHELTLQVGSEEGILCTVTYPGGALLTCVSCDVLWTIPESAEKLERYREHLFFFGLLRLVEINSKQYYC